MEHFSFNENPDALKSTVSKVLCDILDIIKRILTLIAILKILLLFMKI